MLSLFWVRVRVMVLNDTFNNISVISWRSVILVEETGVPGENHRPAINHWQYLYSVDYHTMKYVEICNIWYIFYYYFLVKDIKIVNIMQCVLKMAFFIKITVFLVLGRVSRRLIRSENIKYTVNMVSRLIMIK